MEDLPGAPGRLQNKVVSGGVHGAPSFVMSTAARYNFDVDIEVFNAS
jgi:hypothetical protein